MPRKRVKSKKRVQKGLSDDQLQHLLIGYSIDGSFPFRDDEHRRQLWELHKDRLLTVEICPDGLRERKPGTYPAAWFDYER